MHSAVRGREREDVGDGVGASARVECHARAAVRRLLRLCAIPASLRSTQPYVAAHAPDVLYTLHTARAARGRTPGIRRCNVTAPSYRASRRSSAGGLRGWGVPTAL